MQGFAASVLVLVALASPANAQPANSPLGQSTVWASGARLHAARSEKMPASPGPGGRGLRLVALHRPRRHCRATSPPAISGRTSATARTPPRNWPRSRRSRRSTAKARPIEWRIERLPNGKPHAFATILRWNVTALDPDNDLKQVAGQVLVVTRLGPGGVCHVGYVDGRANPNANELAAELADKHARAFKCGKDKPITLGVQGKGFSGLYGG